MSTVILMLRDEPDGSVKLGMLCSDLTDDEPDHEGPAHDLMRKIMPLGADAAVDLRMDVSAVKSLAEAHAMLAEFPQPEPVHKPGRDPLDTADGCRAVIGVLLRRMGKPQLLTQADFTVTWLERKYIRTDGGPEGITLSLQPMPPPQGSN